MRGKVVTLKTNKFFGFIFANGTEYFFHKSDLMGEWLDLEEAWNTSKSVDVEFENIQTPKGPRAKNVRFALNG